MRNRTEIKKYFKWIGTALMLVAMLYVVRTIWDSKEIIAESFSPKCAWIMLLQSVVVLFYSIIHALLFKRTLNALTGKDVGFHAVVCYIESTLYKYLPGNVMHYVGRNRIAEEGIAGYKEINLTTVLEIIMSIVAAGGLSLLLSGRQMYRYLADRGLIHTSLMLLVLCIAILFAVVFIYLFNKKGRDFTKKYVNRTTISSCCVMGLTYCVTNFAFNFCYTVLLQALGADISLAQYPSIIGCCLGAWLIGYLMPGAPGGIGVREAMLNILLADKAPLWAISSAGILTRISQIVGELLAFVIIMVIWKSHPQSKASS